MRPSEIINITTPVTDRIGEILDQMAEDIKELKEEAGLRFDILFKEREYER